MKHMSITNGFVSFKCSLNFIKLVQILVMFNSNTMDVIKHIKEFMLVELIIMVVWVGIIKSIIKPSIVGCKSIKFVQI